MGEVAKEDVEGFEKLRDVLERAYNQAARGKGIERHGGNGVAFTDQPIFTISEIIGTPAGLAFQICKKAQEAMRLPQDAAIAELLGAIVYASAMVICLEDQRYKP